MGYWIFDNLALAEAYTKEIEEAQGIPRPGTDRWGDPIKAADEDLWAVVESTGYYVAAPADAFHMELLPDTWWGTP